MQTSLGSYLLRKTNGVPIRRVNIFLERQTWGDTDFSKMVLFDWGSLSRDHYGFLQKMLFYGLLHWVWSAEENFLKVVRTCCAPLQTSLGSYLLRKTNGVLIRHVNNFLERQTWGDTNFFDLVLPQHGILRIRISPKHQKVVIFAKLLIFKVL